MTPPTGTKRQRNVARREIMQVGALSLFAGMSVSRFLDVATADEAKSAPAKSVILFNPTIFC